MRNICVFKVTTTKNVYGTVYLKMEEILFVSVLIIFFWGYRKKFINMYK